MLDEIIMLLDKIYEMVVSTYYNIIDKSIYIICNSFIYHG